MHNYNAHITRKTPGCVIFCIDLSGSMAEYINFEGERVTKAASLSQIINISIDELIFKCKKEYGYGDYFDIAVIGYSNDKVESLLYYLDDNKEFATINELLRCEVPATTYNKLRVLPDGRSFTSAIRVREWIKPKASGNTPTYMALKKVYSMASSWYKSHEKLDCFPPIVIHITDGIASDAGYESLIDIASKIKSLGPKDGNVLLLNVHLASTSKSSVLFPMSIREIDQENEFANLIYESSSTLPPVFYNNIRIFKDLNSISEITKVKGMGYNCSVSEILNFITIGTSTMRNK